MKRILLLASMILGFAYAVNAQDAVSFLLASTNNLRARNGLPAYSLHPALAAAANNQAQWMATNNRVQHTQFDGSTVRARATGAGFPSSWVGENIYMGTGAGPATAWNWWLNSPVHYAGLVSPNYDSVGIGSATVGSRSAIVMVFGNSTGRLAQAPAGAGNDNGGNSAPAAQPAYILGLDAVGNIRHEVQPGHTIGDIALIYGYTWDDIPAMLTLNGMTSNDIRLLQPGSEFLVPPKAGTYTPTAAGGSPTAQESATPTPVAHASETRLPATATAAPGATSEIAINFRLAPMATPSTKAPTDRRSAEALPKLLALGFALLLQTGVLCAASITLLKRS